MTQTLEARPDSTAADLRQAILARLAYAVGKEPAQARGQDWYVATALAVRDRVVDRWMATLREVKASGQKRVCYLSLEFLIGRLLTDAISNLGLTQPCREALRQLGVDFDEIKELEPDAALGNGGLGRLAACFMESMASLGIAAFGYGIRYDHGLFRQAIQDGRQVELPEDWLDYGNSWEFERPEVAYEVGFGGQAGPGDAGWVPAERVLAVAHDTPLVGWQGRWVNTLRLWSARAVEPMRLEAFNRGEHVSAFAHQLRSTSISRVLYPDDSTPAGQELRLKQEYFFVSASLQDLLRRHLQEGHALACLPQQVAIQLNDTHPALAVPELIRLLVDLHGLGFAEALGLARATFGYTNHTLMPEALKSWPVPLLERLLPRHLQLIFEINAHHMKAVRRLPGSDAELCRELSLIDESHGRRVRMGHLAFVGARKVNGVSALHSRLMAETVFAGLNRVYPDRITNKTNGITELRRWLLQANPELASLITGAIGQGWITDTEQLAGLLPHLADPAFCDRFAAIKRRNKERLAGLVADRLGLAVDPDAMFDVQVKRIHEYKRQLLNILETVAAYLALRDAPQHPAVPRVKIFAGKAAASYERAKLIIRLVNDVARLVNRDPQTRDRLQVAFLPNYNVSLAEAVIPAADLSEQISTAGMEASGTGNMKLALNGAVTIGTLDGANIEIGERVGWDNILVFGLTAAEVAQRRPGFQPRAAVEATPALAEALAAIRAGLFSPDEPHRYAGLVDDLMRHDPFMVTADFAAYAGAQAAAAALYAQPGPWRRVALRNTAGMGWFSADRTIRGYATEIWTAPMRVDGPAGR